MAAVPVRCTGWAHGAGGRVAQRRSVEGRVVLAERVSKLPDFGRGGAWRIESHPDVLSSGWSGVGAQVLDPKVGQVRGDSIGVEPGGVGAVASGVEVECEQPVSVVRAGEIDRPRDVRCRRRHRRRGRVVVCPARIDPHA
ncbi:hypothetical protein GS463_29270 [Rhodococcus hoagii]|nr:hypothetical protein [Prescottella equi]NKT12146.1 hypothetical protein [Prescottella equi]NKU87616.1 hypothetical protein [Prescottella equi]